MSDQIKVIAVSNSGPKIRSRSEFALAYLCGVVPTGLQYNFDLTKLELIEGNRHI